MTKSNTMVFFEIHDILFVKEYCKKIGISFPVMFERENRDYCKSDFKTWEILYRNCPYAVTGCYPC